MTRVPEPGASGAGASEAHAPEAGAPARPAVGGPADHPPPADHARLADHAHLAERSGRRSGRRRSARLRWGAGALLAVPVATALFGPFLAPVVTPPDGAPYVLGDGHPLGTDGLGRDVLGLVLRGGPSALGMACCAVALAYLVGGALGLTAAATRHRWLDELLLRPTEILLAVPSLIVISVVGVGWRGEPTAITLAVAAINVPAVARLVRAAALDAASSPAAEALRMQGESRARVLFGYVGRSVLPVAAADGGTRIATTVFTVAAANFLGLGLDPTSPDWGVTIASSREALLVQPWAVCAPAAMLVMFTVGLNLLADRSLRRRRTRGTEDVR